jgi:hypothetical protein
MSSPKGRELEGPRHPFPPPFVNQAWPSAAAAEAAGGAGSGSGVDGFVGSLWNRPHASGPEGFVVCPFPLVLGPETQLCMFEPLINARQILINFKVVKLKEEGNNARQIYSCILLMV